MGIVSLLRSGRLYGLSQLLSVESSFFGDVQRPDVQADARRSHSLLPVRYDHASAETKLRSDVRNAADAQYFELYDGKNEKLLHIEETKQTVTGTDR